MPKDNNQNQRPELTLADCHVVAFFGHVVAFTQHNIQEIPSLHAMATYGHVVEIDFPTV